VVVESSSSKRQIEPYIALNRLTKLVFAWLLDIDVPFFLFSVDVIIVIVSPLSFFYLLSI